MKVAAFRALLSAAEGLYRDAGNAAAAQALNLLAGLLAAHDVMTVAAFAGLIAKVPAADSGVAAGETTVAQLKGVLASLESFCHATGAKPAEKDLRVLIDVLDAHSAEPLASFATHVQAWLSEAAAKPKGLSKTAATKSAMANEAAIASYLTALRNAGTDRAAFEAVLARLKTDKSVKSAALSELARRYANSVTKYKSTAAAHADIASAFTQQARFANKVVRP
jgi:hypothetical protein